MYITEEDTVTNFNWNVALQEYMFEYELVNYCSIAISTRFLRR